ncbi:WYL domain-containing protein [Microbispora sp. RL4-1S]|uniref:WYL domain-containing protein n=1 Tax=Microbispora oryzae TaxID=2806554 RepID=A0A940WQY2_9ACTN|nr:WYL domain-containing protein [Microbispora oryzae]MBP2708317.1 WYL domain-containing protein [Microbispora oryzae]
MANVIRHTLTAEELAALALSLAHLGAGPQSVTARRGLRHAFAHLDLTDDVIARTLTTLTTPLPTDVARRARVVANAITARLVIRIQYHDAEGRLTFRDVEPVTCLVHGEFWYLVGWCRMRRSVRAFRFDRILSVESTDLPARPHLPQRYLPFQRRSGTGRHAKALTAPRPPAGEPAA